MQNMSLIMLRMVTDRIRRAEVTEEEIQKWLRRTPGKHGAAKDLFRKIDNRGLISFTEYLFLLSVLISNHSSNLNELG